MYYRLNEKTNSKGKALKMYRFKHDLTRKELAEMVGLHVSSVGKYENDSFKKGSKTEKFMDEVFAPYIDELAVYKKKEEDK